MRSKAPLLLVAVVALAALAFFLTRGQSSEPLVDGLGGVSVADETPTPQEDVELAGVGAGSANVARAAVGAAVAPVATLDEGAHPWAGKLAGVVGRLVEEDGTPVTEMRVELLEGDFSSLMKIEHSALQLESPDLDEDFTDDEGRFHLDGARRGAYHVLNIGRGTGRATLRVIEQALEHGELTDLGDIVMLAFGTIVGTVIDEDGEPVAGARVRAAPVPDIVMQSGILDLREGSVVAGGEEDDRKMAFDIPRRAFQLYERLPIPTTTTAADGSFRLEGVVPGMIAGGADKPEHVAATFGSVELGAGEEKDVGELELLFGRTITGQVTDGAGKPVAGVEVAAGALNPLFPAGLMQPAGVTDESGNYSLDGIPEEGALLGIARRTRSEAWLTADGKPGQDVVDFVLPTATPVLVKVRDQEGEPVPDAEIYLTGTSSDMDMFGGMMAMTMLEGSSGERAKATEIEIGDYLLKDVTYGEWAVEARAPGFAPAYGDVVHSGEGTSITLNATRGNYLRVTVTEAATGNPVPTGHAMLVAPKGPLFDSYAAAWTNAEGVCELGPLSATFLEDVNTGRSFFGGVSVVVEHPEHGTTYVDVKKDLAFIEGTLDVAVAMPPSCTVEGRVTWAGEAPAGLYMLVLRNADERNVKAQSTAPPRTTLSNQEGRFKFTGVAPGEYKMLVMERWLEGDPISLMIEQKEPVMLEDRRFEVEPGDPTFVEFALSETGAGPTGRFAGRITADGAGVPDLKVRIRGLPGDDLEIMTNSLGEFETPEISTMERVGIQIKGPVPMADGSLQDQEIYDDWDRVAADEVKRIDIDLSSQKVIIAVVDRNSGDPISDAKISLKRDGRRRWRGGQTATSNGKGIAEIILPKEGEQEMFVTHPDYGRLTMTVRPSDNGETIRAELQPSVVCKGTVIAPEGGLGGRAFVRVKGQRGGEGWSQVDPEELTFSFSNMMPGKHRAEMWAGAQGLIEVEFELGSNGSEDIVLDFMNPAD